MVSRLCEDCKNHTGTHAEKVRAFSETHAELLHSYPMLYRTICKGTFRPEALRLLLNARDRLDAGHDTEAVQKELAEKAIVEVENVKKNVA